ncbi:helix-turn-helix protein [Pontibacter ummariensis]|uniref:Helix-turn-helix domain-containing protein n=2 Tax=Pontibacter ummariensis TaxID=1610492 RepID=A0A239DS52_9BACT|nr:helix-turn-helix protein [Pontibacter ummariensis]SNS34951.1 Helix-turn-helix domain-containing protein [Pontibacter ummariensis]
MKREPALPAAALLHTLFVIMSKESLHQKVLRIKNMVCPRCIMVVREELERLGLHVLEVELGSAVIDGNEELNEAAVEGAMNSKGFELLHDKREELVESIKVAVINVIYTEKIATLTTNLSTYLAEELGRDYSTISTAFKASEGITLNRYIILQKVERVKELLTYDELALNAVATKLGYKSLQHLSSQFKEVTGTTCMKYKKQGGTDRHTIDNLH